MVKALRDNLRARAGGRDSFGHLGRENMGGSIHFPSSDRDNNQESSMPGSHGCSVDGVLSPQRLMPDQEPATTSHDVGPTGCPSNTDSIHPLQPISRIWAEVGWGNGGFHEKLLEDKVSILTDSQSNYLLSQQIAKK